MIQKENLDRCKEVWDELDEKFQLREKGWKWTINGRLRNALGRCNWNNKMVEMSEWLLSECGVDQVEDTMRHEVAHAISSPLSGHNAEWKRNCILTGAQPRRLASGVKSPSMRQPDKWAIMCGDCDEPIALRQTRRMRLETKVCGRCGGTDLYWEAR